MTFGGVRFSVFEMQWRKLIQDRSSTLSYSMSDLAVLLKQHTQIGEGLAALQMLTSHLPDAVMVSSIKDHNLCFGDADGEAIGCTE